MNGDIGLVENVTGMQPDPAKHSTAFVIQPVSNLGSRSVDCCFLFIVDLNVVIVALIAATFRCQSFVKRLTGKR